ncbi:MAG: hypothetical protein PHS57_02260 [Alphaproteobacteria bacterium]|nr:hypothetical protein [Alphaproteobacteria bacterium]
MSLPRHLFSSAFRHHHLGRSFAVIVGIMVFIATFATVAEVLLVTTSYIWGRSVETRLTVEIPDLGDEASLSQAERLAQALAVLKALPNVKSVTPLQTDDVEKLLSPWFNKPEVLHTLPLPALIDVEQKANGRLNVHQVEDALRAVIPDAKVNDHGTWTQDIWRLVHGLAVLGGATILLTGLTLVIAVSLICRAVIAAEYETIALLHLMGAEQTDIAQHFQKLATDIALRAAAIGFALALGVTLLLFSSAKGFADFSSLQWFHWFGVGLIAFAVPLCATAIASLAARYSVMRQIQSFP